MPANWWELAGITSGKTMLHWGRKGSAEEEAEVDDDDDNVTTIVILDMVGDLNVVASRHRETNALKLIVVTYVKEIQTKDSITPFLNK